MKSQRSDIERDKLIKEKIIDEIIKQNEKNWWKYENRKRKFFLYKWNEQDGSLLHQMLKS